MGKGLEKGTSQTSVDRATHGDNNTPTALKVAGIVPWVHQSRAKRAFDPNETQLTERWTSRPDPSQPLHLQLHWDVTPQMNSQPPDSPNTEPLRISSPALVTLRS
jgi:hypothetical protein